MAEQGTFRFIEHTADAGIALEGGSYRALLQAACDGFLTLCFGTLGEEAAGGEPVVVREQGFEDLLIELLRGLLFRIETDRVRIDKVIVETATAEKCTARVFVSPLGSEDEVVTPVKAVTYHGLELKNRGGRMSITVVFDL